MQNFRVTKSVEFDYGHRIYTHPGKCKNVHGHHGKLQVTIEGPLNEASGMVADFKDLKECLAPLVDRWDHKLLIALRDEEFWRRAGYWPSLAEAALVVSVRGIGDVYICDGVPTAEYLARAAYVYLDFALKGVSVVSVKFWETPTSSAEYRPSNEDNATAN